MINYKGRGDGSRGCIDERNNCTGFNDDEDHDEDNDNNCSGE